MFDKMFDKTVDKAVDKTVDKTVGIVICEITQGEVQIGVIFQNE